ncbi:hypothetical protein GUJ93_ZPchr0014g46918 [Zizania palustris]|uniref:Uncharacterized protein n=1 Tax=Zizania palustris TaxID=103762 RepID=A0A8J5TBB6_ZIZPA|nr:hypothetical protein GUJ93_ZPchr0014g46918 [Zizania palustris]
MVPDSCGHRGHGHGHGHHSLTEKTGSRPDRERRRWLLCRRAARPCEVAVHVPLIADLGSPNPDPEIPSLRQFQEKIESEISPDKLKVQVDKLEVHERELFGTTQVLTMQSKTFKICIFGLVQLILLSLSLNAFFTLVSAPLDDVVPT